MNNDISKFLDAWQAFAKVLNKYPPKSVEYLPFKIEWIDGKYILTVDLTVFDDKKEQ